MFNFGTDEWTAVEDYPFNSGSYVAYYDMIYSAETSSYLVIGGYGSGGTLSQIARFKNEKWSDVGLLNTPRYVSSCFKLTIIFKLY